MEEDFEDELDLEFKKQEVIDLGVKVFGSVEKFGTWLRKGRADMLDSIPELKQLEERLIALDEGYSL